MYLNGKDFFFCLFWDRFASRKRRTEINFREAIIANGILNASDSIYFASNLGIRNGESWICSAKVGAFDGIFN